MAENNADTVFFVDDDLIEKLMRGDTGSPASRPSARPAEAGALSVAVKLASEGKLDEAIRKLDEAARKGESPVEVQTALGHLRFEQQKWDEAARCYAKAIEAEPPHRTAHYNLGLCLERQGKFGEALKAFERALIVD